VTLVWFLLLVGLLITVHELGHFAAARWLDIKVLKVSIGFGPKLAALRRGDTEYTLAAVPFGGYVRLCGEEGGPVAPEERAHAFCLRPSWQRLAVILAGPLANLMFPVFLFIDISARQATARSATVGAVFAGQPAAEADLRPGDRVTAVDGQPVRYWDELNRLVARAPGRALRVTVERPGAGELTKYVTPREHYRTDLLGARAKVGLIGVAPHFRLPQVGVFDGDAAWQAGLRSFDVVTSIQGRPIASAADLEPLVRPRSGGMLLVTYLRPAGDALGFAPVARLEPHTAQVVPRLVDGRYDSGLRPADLFIHAVEPGTPAAALGLAPGDLLLALDGTPLTAWELLAQAFEERPEEEHRLAWRGSDGREHQGRFRLDRRRALDEYQAESTLFVLGAETARAIRPVPETRVEARLSTAIGEGLGRTLTATATMARVLVRTLAGDPSALGGPILIYQVAGVAAQHGVEQFLAMAALVSLNLGLLNLLPVPLLDGGQASLVVIEALRRRPVSRRARERAAWLGVSLLVGLMLLVARNDIVRSFFR
jgi:regulator of sigma E protease